MTRVGARLGAFPTGPSRWGGVWSSGSIYISVAAKFLVDQMAAGVPLGDGGA